jgi:hypothetical protein
MNLSDHPFLFTVTDCFSIDGRGTLVVPGVPWNGVPTVKRGDPLILRTPLGEIIETTIKDVEMISGSRIRASPVLFPSNIQKSDVPIGTEVFLGITATAATHDH